MAYKVIILYQLYMPSYFLGTFTEYPYLSSSNTELCRRFLYLFVSGVIIAWQAKPELKTINFNERRFPDLS